MVFRCCRFACPENRPPFFVDRYQHITRYIFSQLMQIHMAVKAPDYNLCVKKAIKQTKSYYMLNTL